MCVGAVVAVWVAGALYNAPHNLHNASHAPRERIPRQPWTGALIVVAVVCAGLAVASRSHFDGLAVGTFWVQVFGLAVLVASTVFTLWARVLARHHMERDAQGPGRSPAASFLARLAGQGRALELGIGTGRIAVPLRQRAVRVHGIDLSAAMIARLRAKPGAAGIGVTIGDFVTTRAGGTFRLAYLVFNTIMSLTTQDQQAECFRNAAAQLEPGGCLVIEVMVPALRRLPPGQSVIPFQVTATGWGYDVYDAATQAITAHYVRITDGRGEHATFPGRYVWPAELDLMAQLAGMTLRERWGGWKHEPFTSETTSHISLWQKST